MPSDAKNKAWPCWALGQTVMCSSGTPALTRYSYIAGTSTRLFDAVAKEGQQTRDARQPLHSTHTSFSPVMTCRRSWTASPRSSTQTATQAPVMSAQTLTIACSGFGASHTHKACPTKGTVVRWHRIRRSRAQQSNLAEFQCRCSISWREKRSLLL